MAQLVQRNETTVAKRSLFFFLTGTDGKTPLLTASGGQPSISVNGSALSTSGVGLLVHLGGGIYTAEVDAIGVDGVVIGFYGLAPGTVDANVTPVPSLQTLQFTVQDPYTEKASFTLADLWAYSSRTLTGVGSGALQEIWNASESIISSGVGNRIKTLLDDNITSRSTFDPNLDQVVIAPTGLDLIPITEPTGRASNLRGVIVQTWMRHVNEVTQDASTQTIKKSDGTTSVSGSVSKAAGVQTLGRKT